jgi:hypothetical protein
VGHPMHSIQDVALYLDGTLCLWDGKPVYVDVGGGTGGKIWVHYCGNRGVKDLVEYTDPRFDYRSLQLGYMQVEHRAYYVERLPWRKTKQGVAYENTFGRSPCGNQIHVGDYLMTAAMRDCVLGQHMTEEEAVRGLMGTKYKSAAVSRNVAIQKESDGKFSLWHKNIKVGQRNHNEQAFTLLSGQHSSFMKRFLEKKVCLQ